MVTMGRDPMYVMGRSDQESARLQRGASVRTTHSTLVRRGGGRRRNAHSRRGDWCGGRSAACGRAGRTKRAGYRHRHECGHPGRCPATCAGGGLDGYSRSVRATFARCHLRAGSMRWLDGSCSRSWGPGRTAATLHGAPSGLVGYSSSRSMIWPPFTVQYHQAPLWNNGATGHSSSSKQSTTLIRALMRLYSEFSAAGLCAPQVRYKVPIGGGLDWLGYDFLRITFAARATCSYSVASPRTGRCNSTRWRRGSGPR